MISADLATGSSIGCVMELNSRRLRQKSLDRLFADFLNELTNFDGMHSATLALAAARNEVAELSAAAKRVSHLNKEIADLREAHSSAEAYAFHLEREVASLHEAHGTAEACAPHRQKKGAGLASPSRLIRLLARLASLR